MYANRDEECRFFNRLKIAMIFSDQCVYFILSSNDAISHIFDQYCFSYFDKFITVVNIIIYYKVFDSTRINFWNNLY